MVEHADELLLRRRIAFLPDELEKHAQTGQRPLVAADRILNHFGELVFGFIVNTLNDRLPQSKYNVVVQPGSLRAAMLVSRLGCPCGGISSSLFRAPLVL